MKGGKSADLHNQVKKNWEQVRRDISESPLLSTTTGDEGYLVASLEDILSYLSLVVLYNAGTESERRVLENLKLNPTERLGERMGHMLEDISRGNVCRNEETFAATELLTNSNAGREGVYPYREFSKRGGG